MCVSLLYRTTTNVDDSNILLAAKNILQFRNRETEFSGIHSVCQPSCGAAISTSQMHMTLL